MKMKHYCFCSILPGLLLEHLGVALAKRSLQQELSKDGGLTTDKVRLPGQERRYREALIHHVVLLYLVNLKENCYNK